MGKRTKAKVGGGKKGDDKKGKRDGGDKGGSEEDRILDTVSPPMSPNTRSARRFAETFLMSSPMSPNTRSRNAGGKSGSGSGKKGGSGDGKGSRSGGSKGGPDGGEEGGTGKEGGSGSGNKKALGSGSSDKKALGSGSGKKGGSGGLGGADTTSGGALGTHLFAEAMSAPVSIMSPNTRARVAALGSADSGNKKALGSGSGKKGRSGGRGGADTKSRGGVGPRLFVQAMSAPVSSMSPNTRARVAVLGGSGSGKKKGGSGGRGGADATSGGGVGPRLFVQAMSAPVSSMSPNTRAHVAALGSGSGKKKGGSGGRGGADATSGGGVGPRLFAKAMLAVSGMSPKTRAGEAAKLSPMSPNTRAHRDAAKTLLFPMVTNTVACAPARAQRTLTYGAVLGEDSAGQKRHAVEDDLRESPRKRARQATTKTKRPHKKVFDDDDEDDITHGNQVTSLRRRFGCTTLSKRASSLIKNLRTSMLTSSLVTNRIPSAKEWLKSSELVMMN